jgi:sugar-specific transcriptional regulator TrmB
MTDLDEDDAIDALQQLGLSQYEAEVFVALEKLGTGTARDVDRITEVPRSQVYGAAEHLEERGLVELQQSNPIQYRAVGLEEARTTLHERYQREEDRAFEYLERAREVYGEDAAEQQEGVWTVQGRENVTSRVRELVADAEDTLLFATPPELHERAVLEAIEARVDELDVTVLTGDDGVADDFAALPGVVVGRPPQDVEDSKTGRLLGADGDTVLLSVLGSEALPGLREETALWSADTAFSTVLLELVKSRFESEINAPL